MPSPTHFLHHLSLKAKLTWLLTLTAIIPVLLIDSYSYNQASKTYEQSARTLDYNDMSQAADAMEQRLSRIPLDLSFLAQFQDLQRYLQWHDIGEQQEADIWKRSTTSGFQSFMLSHSQYMQLRVIDAHGQEVIRLERNTGQHSVKIMPQQYLQNKKTRDYFIRTMQLKAGQYFVSAMNLNREHGAIQQPYLPVIRYALPLIDRNDTPHGIIILNVYGANILAKAAQQVDTDDQANDVMYTVNQKGFYLSHSNKNKTFGFELPHNNNLKLDHPELWEAMQSNRNTLITENMVFAFKKIYPLKSKPSQFWFVIHASPASESLAELISFQQVFAAIVVFLLLALLLISRPVIHRIVQPVRQLTQNMQRLERGETLLQKVRYNSNDEFRDLVDASNGMGQRITAAIKQANTIAQGDFHSEITAYSDKDELAIALQNMLQTLQQVTAIAEAVALGDLSNTIDVKGKHDRLGLSINSMITTMRNTTQHAQAIAHGNFSTNVKVQSKSDELGYALQEMNQTLSALADVAAAIAT
ncbi:MAG: HAMP domain-containing protein, partial [Mariprofundus sp.]|nr:HAMP domain-containing protein [Mariprofundus sp.]